MNFIQKIPINFCPTGMVPTKDQTPYVPLHPAEIVDQVHMAFEAGVTIVHLHARDKDGKPDWRPETYSKFVEPIRKFCPDLVICLSTSGRNVQEFEKRSAVIELGPDMCSLTLGSVNFIRSASINEPHIIEKLLEKMIEYNVRPEFECFDLGMINFGLYLKNKFQIEMPCYWNLISGNLTGFQPIYSDLASATSKINREDIISIAGVGDYQLTAAMLAIGGGHGIRIGLEDNIWWDRNRTILATNQSLLNRVIQLLEINQLSPMKPAEFRRLLKW